MPRYSAVGPSTFSISFAEPIAVPKMASPEFGSILVGGQLDFNYQSSGYLKINSFSRPDCILRVDYLPYRNVIAIAVA